MDALGNEGDKGLILDVFSQDGFGVEIEETEEATAGAYFQLLQVEAKGVEGHSNADLSVNEPSQAKLIARDLEDVVKLVHEPFILVQILQCSRVIVRVPANLSAALLLADGMATTDGVVLQVLFHL